MLARPRGRVVGCPTAIGTRVLLPSGTRHSKGAPALDDRISYLTHTNHTHGGGYMYSGVAIQETGVTFTDPEFET